MPKQENKDYSIVRQFVWVSPQADQRDVSVSPVGDLSRITSGVRPIPGAPDPKSNSGEWGILKDAGTGCEGEPLLTWGGNASDPSTSTGPPDFADRNPSGLPIIAFVHLTLGDHAASSPWICSSTDAIHRVSGIPGVSGIITYPSDPTYVLDEDSVHALELPPDQVHIPVYAMDSTIGMNLLGDIRTANNTTTTDVHGNTYAEYVRVSMFPPSKSQLSLWEYALIIVAVFLVFIFFIVVFAHYILSRRRRAMNQSMPESSPQTPRTMEGVMTPALPFGPGTTLWMSQSIPGYNRYRLPLLDKPTLESYPLQVYTSEEAEEVEQAIVPQFGAPIPDKEKSPGEEHARYIMQTCSVCLDDFLVGDELRLLPCGHRFHSMCIDPWLLNKSSCCPLCKRDFSRNIPSTSSPSPPPDTTPSPDPSATQPSSPSSTELQEGERGEGGGLTLVPQSTRDHGRRGDQHHRQSHRHPPTSILPSMGVRRSRITQPGDPGQLIQRPPSTHQRTRWIPWPISRASRNQNEEEERDMTTGHQVPSLSLQEDQGPASQEVEAVDQQSIVHTNSETSSPSSTP
ncbi:MAG: hypothetical protein DHS80DRAFT_33322 [Piptocephalis tieghemiana]|nr:MAG: hypothetical protein DHS80DRAFT_33322 [Piptocephalis tieghemiana]